MAGRVKKLIDEFIELRAGGNEGLEHFVKAHLALSGVGPQHYSDHGPDDPVIVAKLEKMIAEFATGKEPSS